MHRGLFPRIAAFIVPVLVAGLYLAGSAGANGSGGVGVAKLGNGPKPPAKTPKGSTLKATQPLISVVFRNGQVTSVTGTAVPKSGLLGAGAPGPKVKTVKCGVNFTHSKLTAGSSSNSVAFFGGIGCGRPMVLFGQTYLQKSAANVVALGSHFQGYRSSEASGNAKALVKGANPSLYIRNLINVNFLNPGGSGNIGVFPAKNAKINAASTCQVSVVKPYGIGVHCDLYSSRF
jgi:hypothetical protein